MIFTDNLGNSIGEKHTVTFNYDYVSIPIKTGLNIGKVFYGFTNIGVIPSLLVDAKTTSPTYDADGKLIGNERFDVTSSVSRFDFAGLVEIGGGHKFKDRFLLFASIAYQHSFTTITNSEYSPNSKIRHNGITLTIGLKCALTKE